MSLSHASIPSAVFIFDSFALMPRISQQQWVTKTLPQRCPTPSGLEGQVFRDAREGIPAPSQGELKATCALHSRFAAPFPTEGARTSAAPAPAWAPPPRSAPASPPSHLRLGIPHVPPRPFVRLSGSQAWRARVRRPCFRALCSARCPSSTSIQIRTRWAEGWGGMQHRLESSPPRRRCPGPRPRAPRCSAGLTPRCSAFSRSWAVWAMPPAR